MDIGEAGDGGLAPVVNQDQEVNVLGKGGQCCNRCRGRAGHWAKECPTAPGKAVDGLKGGPGGKGEKWHPEEGYPKGWQQKIGKDAAKC